MKRYIQIAILALGIGALVGCTKNKEQSSDKAEAETKNVREAIVQVESNIAESHAKARKQAVEPSSASPMDAVTSTVAEGLEAGTRAAQHSAAKNRVQQSIRSAHAAARQRRAKDGVDKGLVAAKTAVEK